ncbi:MAG: DUF58 domain-containing protein [Candidatus Cryosericum sp.]
METQESNQLKREPREGTAPGHRPSFLPVFLTTGRNGFVASTLMLTVALLLRNALFFVAGFTALCYTIFMCSLMLIERHQVGVTTVLRHSVTVIRQPNVITLVVSGHGTSSPLLVSVEPQFPLYAVPRRRTDDGDTTAVFFDVTRKGEYAIGAVRILIQDPLRMFHVERAIGPQFVLTVVPRSIPLAALHIALTSPLDGQRIRYAPNVDTSQLIGTHPYDGESMNRIHWKASAHTGTLVVKDFSPSASQTVVVLVDYTVHRDTIFTLETLDNTLSTAAASILHYVHDHKLPFGLVTIGSSTEWTGSGHDSMHLYRCLAVIARATPERCEGVDGVSDWLARSTHAVPPQSQLVVLTYEVSETEIVHLLKLRERFSRITIILFPAGSFLLPGEHRAPYYFKDTSELLRLRSLQHTLKENRIDLVVIGLNDPLTG